MDITSPQNPRVKHIVKLREEKKQRERDGLMLVEGYDEIELALASGYVPQTLFIAPELATRHLSVLSPENYLVSKYVFEKMSYRKNPDGLLAVFPLPRKKMNDLQLTKNPLLIIAESIEKPGNLGAILRTADAAQVEAILLCDPRVDAWNPNVVRASRGAIFSVPVVESDNALAFEWLRSKGIHILAATPSADSMYTDVNLKQPLAIAVGTEDAGLTDFWMDNAETKVKIPMLGKINSLNVSVSTALIAYEALRQRNASR